MKSRSEKDVKLQTICRRYLMSLYSLAEKYGLKNWLTDIIDANKSGKCKATEKEIAALSRFLDDERISRKDVPKIIGKSYRQCNEDNTFDKIKKLKRVGIYSKISALLLKHEKRN